MIGNEKTLQARLTRRTLVFGGGALAAFGTLAGRLYYLQITQEAEYAALSDDNRFRYHISVPSRGRILDRFGDALAINRQDYRVVIIPEAVKNIDITLEAIGETISLLPNTKERIKRDIRNNARFIPVLVKDHLTWNDFATLNFRSHELPGVITQVGEGRAYPHMGVFSHVLGFVGRAGPDDMDGVNDRLFRQPTFRIGKTGVEAVADETLRGNSGRLKVEVNAVGRVVREWPEQSERARSGQDVSLTLDAGLQRHAADLFEDDSGGAVVIDVLTGEIRTLLSMPTFDGNLFVSGLTQADMERMNTDEKRPQFNKVIGGGYPPASTFKMVVLLAALEAGIIDPQERVICRGKVPLGNRVFHCYLRRGHGPMNMRDSLKHSCDVYYYELVQKLGIDAIRTMALRLGLGQRYKLGIPGQTAGLIPDDAWKQARLGDGWRTGDTLNAGIGQGFVLATPLQLAVMTARMANGADAIMPHLLVGDNLTPPTSMGVNPEHLEFIREAMWSVCNEPGGTAYNPAGLEVDDVQMAGKTGTGQVKRITTQERLEGVRRNEDLPWRFRDHSIFVGFAPYIKPRFAVSVIVEHGGSGAKRAASISRALLKQAISTDNKGLNQQASVDVEL